MLTWGVRVKGEAKTEKLIKPTSAPLSNLTSPATLKTGRCQDALALAPVDEEKEKRVKGES